MNTSSRAALFALTLAASPALAQQDSLTHSMQNAMDPQVMTNLMNSMMTNPVDMMNNPMASCAQCHDGNDIARYQQGMGPFMAMMNPANWFSPQAYMNMMTGMMDPRTYEVWYNGMMGKYAGMYGAAPADAGAAAAPSAPAASDDATGDSATSAEDDEATRDANDS